MSYEDHKKSPAELPLKGRSMPSAIERIRSRLISEFGIPRILYGKRSRSRLTILMYHAVVRLPLEVPHWCFIEESSFRRQVHYLKRRFEVVTLSEAVERLRSGRFCSPTAVITFDDGFQNNCDIAFPILREARLPATVFLTTGLTGTCDTLWFCRLQQAIGNASLSALEWNGQRLNLSGLEAKVKASAALRMRLKQLQQPQLLAEVRRIVEALGDDPDRAIEAGSPFQMLNREAIAEMSASGLVEFGAHTHTHAILSRLSLEQRRDEIRRSVNMVQDLTGRPCHLFAYPNGRSEDFDEETIGLLEAYGIRASLTAIPGPNDAGTPLMRLRRYSIGPKTSMARFRLMVHHGVQ